MNHGKKYRRRVTEYGIYLNKKLYDSPKIKPYIGKNLIVLLENGTLEVHSFHSGFICYFKESEGIPTPSKSRNWGGMKDMKVNK